MLTIDEAFRKFKSRLELNEKEQANASARQPTSFRALSTAQSSPLSTLGNGVMRTSSGSKATAPPFHGADILVACGFRSAAHV